MLINGPNQSAQLSGSSRHWLRRSTQSAILFAILLLGTAGAAYGYGTQWHGSPFRNGCNADNGCYGPTNKAGDYVREGWTWHESSTNQDYFYSGIWSAETGAFQTDVQCFNCYIIHTQRDVNPNWECDYKTWHVVVDNSVEVLNGHYHWTEAATSSSGC